MCPVSMRRPDERGALGNLVSMIFAPLHVGMLDPVARLTAEREAMTRLKDQDQAGGLYEMTHLMEPRAARAARRWPGSSRCPNTCSTPCPRTCPGPRSRSTSRAGELIGWYPLIPSPARSAW